MSLMNLIKKMVEKYRKDGRSEEEIEEAVQEASEKSTVAGKYEEQRGAAVSAEGQQSRIWVDQTVRSGEMWVISQDANNWKKMHGMVMTRRKKKGK